MSAATSTQLHSLEVEPIAGAIGAEITGVDLADLDDATVAEIRRAWLEHLVVFFRDQDARCPTRSSRSRAASASRCEYPFVQGHRRLPGDHRGHEAAARDGELRRHLAQRHRVPRAAADGDDADRARGPAVRRRHDVREHVRGVRRALARRCSALLDGLRAVNSSALADVSKTREDRIRDSGGRRATRSTSPSIPVVRTHPETGRKALYVNVAHTRALRRHDRGREPAAAASTCSSTRSGPSSRAASTGGSGSLALWDNRCAMHNPINDYHGYTRTMHRITPRRRHAADGGGPGRSTLVLTGVEAPGGRRMPRACHRRRPPSSSSATPSVTTSPRTSRTARARGASSRTSRAAERRSGRTCATDDRPPHIGVLLDNTAEYLFWLGAAASRGR